MFLLRLEKRIPLSVPKGVFARIYGVCVHILIVVVIGSGVVVPPNCMCSPYPYWCHDMDPGMQRVRIDMDLDGHIEHMSLVLMIVAFLQTEGMDKSTLHMDHHSNCGFTFCLLPSNIS